jgi:hypothetical protein
MFCTLFKNLLSISLSFRNKTLNIFVKFIHTKQNIKAHGPLVPIKGHDSTIITEEMQKWSLQGIYYQQINLGSFSLDHHSSVFLSQPCTFMFQVIHKLILKNTRQEIKYVIMYLFFRYGLKVQEPQLEENS